MPRCKNVIEGTVANCEAVPFGTMVSNETSRVSVVVGVLAAESVAENGPEPA